MTITIARRRLWHLWRWNFISSTCNYNTCRSCALAFSSQFSRCPHFERQKWCCVWQNANLNEHCVLIVWSSYNSSLTSKYLDCKVIKRFVSTSGPGDRAYHISENSIWPHFYWCIQWHVCSRNIRGLSGKFADTVHTRANPSNNMKLVLFVYLSTI